MKFIENLKKKNNIKKICKVLSNLQSNMFNIEYDKETGKLMCTLKYDFKNFDMEKSISRDWIGNIVFNLIDSESLKEMLKFKRVDVLNDINSIEYKFGNNAYLSNERDMLDNIIIKGNSNVTISGHYKSVNSFIVDTDNINLSNRSEINAKEDVKLIAKNEINLNDYSKISSDNGIGYIKGNSINMKKNYIEFRDKCLVLDASDSLNIVGDTSKAYNKKPIKSYINAKNLFAKSRFSNIKYADISVENELKMKFGRLDISESDVDALNMDIKSNKIENRININFLSEKFLLDLKRGQKLQSVVSNNYLFNNKEVTKRKKTFKIEKNNKVVPEKKENINNERTMLLATLKDIKNQSEMILNEQIKNLQCRACSKVMIKH